MPQWHLYPKIRGLVLGDKFRSGKKETKMKTHHLVTCFLFLIFAGGEARVVSVPEGPLVRVEGQPLSLRCNVSEYEGPLEQVFEWQVFQESKSFQLISFMESSYTDARFAKRVTDGDISLLRLADSAAELRIRALRASDRGTYTCSTPSTDMSVSGNYQASVLLDVIKDSLQVLSMVPPAEIPEGDPLNIHCIATRDLKQNTYLSVTWSVRRGTAPPEDIVTLGPDGDHRVGAGYIQRHADMGLFPQTMKGNIFSLVLTETRPSDEGQYTCTAREWVPERGALWQPILEKSAELGLLKIIPIAESLEVFLEKNATLNLDDTLHLTCSVALNNQVNIALEVTWLVGPGKDGSNMSRILAHMNQDGVLANGSGPGEISRTGVLQFQLLLRHVDQSDSGFYSCKVLAWLRQSGGRWVQAAEKTSHPVHIWITTMANFNVTLSSPVTPQILGQPMVLVCQMNGEPPPADARLGVTWYHHSGTIADTGIAPQPIAALDEQGDLVLWDDYRPLLEQGHIVLSKVKPRNFRLHFQQIQDSDQGTYHCAISVWTRVRNGGWTKNQEVRSEKLSIKWGSKNPRLYVVAHRLKEASRAGATFEMSCQVISQNLLDPGYSVLIRMEESIGTQPRKIASLSPDLVMKLEEWSEPDRLDSVVLEKTGPREFRFRLYGAMVSDRGFYFCDVTAWTRDLGKAWTKAVNAASNRVQISFTDTGPSFNISIRTDAANVYPGETTKMECILGLLGGAPNAGAVSYEVQWYLSSHHASAGATLLASMDRWGVVRKSPRNSSSDCSLERADAQTFRLSVHQTQDLDAGEYHCRATPWLRSPAGTWTRGSELTSTRIFLIVRFALWDSMKLPLLYGLGATLAVGLFSLLLGLMCAHCWCRNSSRTPHRLRSNLIALEMD
ncbi:prostaglandin F2 receptor negative regulator isoform X2 [Brienomyrus brachyistius]|uniref:prostaglandin F2 receptor negative regulator isoform X2 n=1 Tax=Brienomyrus brachyistius TaxID=42636 RepID=UPI0020B397D3|nr:prostaglandin F2 receptor negative regulator isoform X2 [Brienomyrus brachyistius]